MREILETITFYQDEQYTIETVMTSESKPVMFDYKNGQLLYYGDDISPFTPYHILCNQMVFYVFNDEIFLCECAIPERSYDCERMNYSNEWLLKYKGNPVCLFDSDGYIIKEDPLFGNSLPLNISDIDEEFDMYIHMKLCDKI